MVIIDIRKIKTVFICPDHNEAYKERCKYMFETLSLLGFEHIIHYKSESSDLYPLNNATHNILRICQDEPILIFEDDIEFIKDPEFIFDIPDHVDALYLGIGGCNFNFDTNKNEGAAKFQNIDSKYTRILNMLSAHAILYISIPYKLKISEALKITNTANDIEICKHQSKYVIYGLRKPICWQSAKFNKRWIEYITKIMIDDSGSAISAL